MPVFCENKRSNVDSVSIVKMRKEKIMNLKTAYEPYFKIGAAISRWNLHTNAHMMLLQEQFSSFTVENDMKPMYFLDKKENRLHPEDHQLEPALCFDHAIPYLEKAKELGIPMRGHTLVWHSQTPKWFFHMNYNENFKLADRETMLARLENYIKGVLTFVQDNYPGQIYAWDVVNEAINDNDFRNSLWTKVIGTDFVEKAFTFARKYAAPGVALFYNDYETALDWKRDLIYEKILVPLHEKGLVDGMGMQCHLLMDHPDFEDYKKALYLYGSLGIQVQMTELDLHNADPSEESMHQLALRYQKLFEIMVEAKKTGKANITAVTFWNLLDENSWLSGFRKETSYPLLFHGKCETKEAYYKVLEVVASKDQIDPWKLNASEKDYEVVGMEMKKPANDIQEVHDFLKECGTYYLATVEGDQPRVRPFGTIDLFEGKLYIQTGKVKNVSKQLQANPKAEICAFSDGTWLRVAGKLIRDDRIEAKKHMLDAYPNLQAMYSAEDDNTEVLYFEGATATFSSFMAPARSFQI